MADPLDTTDEERERAPDREWDADGLAWEFIDGRWVRAPRFDDNNKRSRDPAVLEERERNFRTKEREAAEEARTREREGGEEARRDEEERGAERRRGEEKRTAERRREEERRSRTERAGEAVTGRQFAAEESAASRAARLAEFQRTQKLTEQRFEAERGDVAFNRQRALQQDRLALASQFASELSVVDPIAFNAFLERSGGVISNAIRMGDTALSERALTPAALTLTAQRAADDAARIQESAFDRPTALGAPGVTVVDAPLPQEDPQAAQLRELRVGGAPLRAIAEVERQIGERVTRTPPVADATGAFDRPGGGGTAAATVATAQPGIPPVTAGDLSSVRALRESAEVPAFNPFDPKFALRSQVQQDLFFNARQTRFGVPATESAAEERRFRLRGAQRGGGGFRR